MDEPPAPPAQPDAAAAAPSTTSASAPSPAPPANPATSAATTVVPPTSVSPTVAPPPNTGTAANTGQTLAPPAPSPAASRPPAPRMRPPYTHLASPITMSSSSSPATSGASASMARGPPSSSAASAAPRGGAVLGIAAPRPAATPVGYTGFVPPPPLAHQFGSMHSSTDQPQPSSTQFRQPSQGIQNIGTASSLGTSQVRPGATSGPQQPRPGSQMTGLQRPPGLTRPMSVSSPSPALQQPPQTASPAFRPQQRPQLPQARPQQSAPMPLHQQNIISAQQQQQSQQQSMPHQSQQNTALKNQLQLSQQQATRASVPMAQKADNPATSNVAIMRSMDTDASEIGNRLLTKRSVRELVAQIDPNEKLDPEVEDVLIDIAEDFVESVASFACSLAKHRKSDTLEAKDVLLHAEKSWNITLPGFSGDEIKLYKKQHVNDIHRERLYLIKKSMASETKASAAQATANQKNQTSKPPVPGSP